MGYKLLKEAGHNHGLKHTMKISESRQSETLLPNISKKEGRLFKLTGKTTGSKSYSFDEAISLSGIFHVMDPEPYQSNSIGQNDKVKSESLPSIINIYKETLRRYVLTVFMLILHITTFQKKTSSNFKENTGQIFGILRYSLNGYIINY